MPFTNRILVFGHVKCNEYCQLFGCNLIFELESSNSFDYMSWVFKKRKSNQYLKEGVSCTVDNASEKLDKLYTFYSKGLNSMGWEKYEKLNIEFNDKVIGTKKNK